MQFGHREKSAQRLISVGLVVLLHVGVLYALVSGLARKAIEVLPAPVEMKIIEELVVKEEPPPPPPPEFKPPKPDFVPPPEVVIAAPPPPAAITAVTTEEPAAESPPTAIPAPAPTVATTAPVIKAKNCREPEYPPVSQRLGENGTVLLAMLVGVDGRVVESKIERSSGYARLDEAARIALSRCRFTPGTSNGIPEPAWAKIKYLWKLPN